MQQEESKKLLVDGWLSPRMKQMLTITAFIMIDIIDIEDSFVKYQAKPISECLGFFGGYPRFEYYFIPTKVFKQNPKGLYKSFVDGWTIVWKAIFNLLKQNQVPTIDAIDREIHTTRANIWKFNHFVDKGGRIDYALDGLFRITENVYVDGEDGWIYEDFKDGIEALPTTVLDGAFAIGRTKCLGNSTEVNEWCSGPYDHSIFLPDDYME